MDVCTQRVLGVGESRLRARRRRARGRRADGARHLLFVDDMLAATSGILAHGIGLRAGGIGSTCNASPGVYLAILVVPVHRTCWLLPYAITAAADAADLLRSGYFMYVSDVEAAFPMLPLAPWLWWFFLFRVPLTPNAGRGESTFAGE